MKNKKDARRPSEDKAAVLVKPIAWDAEFMNMDNG